MGQRGGLYGPWTAVRYGFGFLVLEPLSGARWMALLEQECESSPLYGCLMAYFYSLALLVLSLS